jgi:hypothetical protein
MPPAAAVAVDPIGDLKLRCQLLCGGRSGPPLALRQPLPWRGYITGRLHRRALAGDPRTVRPDSIGMTAETGLLSLTRLPPWVMFFVCFFFGSVREFWREMSTHCFKRHFKELHEVLTTFDDFLTTFDDF